MSYVIAGLLQGLFWLTILGLALWLCRRFAPSLEGPLFKVNFIRGAWMLIQSLIARIRGRRLVPHDPSTPAAKD